MNALGTWMSLRLRVITPVLVQLPQRFCMVRMRSSGVVVMPTTTSFLNDATPFQEATLASGKSDDDATPLREGDLPLS